MEIAEILPFMEKGQWWATKKPLVLHQVTSPGNGLACFKMWSPIEGITDATYVEPLDDNWVYLWFSGVISVDYFQDKDLRQGDAYWSIQSRQVFLLGPLVEREFVTILSDAPVTIDPSNKFQRLSRGPLDPSTEPKSVYDRILEQ
jgi:hypothetical protein